MEKTLNQLLEHLGDRTAVVGRELTKLYEEVIRGNLSDIIMHFSKSKVKGEIVIMIGKDDDRINFSGKFITVEELMVVVKQLKQNS